MNVFGYEITMSSVLREKYFNIARNKNLDVAVTELHIYLNRLESELYVGGFNEEKFAILEDLRVLSRELWELRLDPSIKRSKG